MLPRFFDPTPLFAASLSSSVSRQYSIKHPLINATVLSPRPSLFAPLLLLGTSSCALIVINIDIIIC